MHVETIQFEPITTSLPTDWVMRIVIRGTGLEPRAMPIVAELGAQKVHGMMPGAEEGVVLGFLTNQPTPGDELLIGRADQPLQATGITFDPGIV